MADAPAPDREAEIRAARRDAAARARRSGTAAAAAIRKGSAPLVIEASQGGAAIKFTFADPGNHHPNSSVIVEVSTPGEAVAWLEGFAGATLRRTEEAPND